MEEKFLFDKKIFSVISDELAFKILYIISIKKKVTLRQLSRELHLNYTLTRQVNKLVKKEYLNRFEPENKRIVELTITSQGKKLLQLYLKHYKNIENLLNENN